MTYEETKELLDQYSVEDLRDLRKMIDESISTRSENEYKKLVREFSDKYKVGDCFLRKYPENMLSIDFVANISEDKVRITRYHINFDDNDICIHDDELILFYFDKYKKSNTKESDVRRICDELHNSIENIYKTAISDIIRLIETSDDI